MRKLTKKQMLATGVVIVLGISGSSALYANHINNVHQQQVQKVQAETKAHDEKLKKEKLAKEKQELQKQIKSIDDVMNVAIKNPTESSIKTATEAVSKLKDTTKKSAYENTLKTLNQRLILINKARSSVKDYQEHATNADKQKEAQNAINALTDKNDSDVKAELQKMFDESNKQAQEASKTNSNGQTVSNNTSSSQSQPTSEKTTSNNAQQDVTTNQGNTASNSNGASTSNNTPTYNNVGGTNSNQTNSNNTTSNNTSGNAGGNNSNSGNSNNTNNNSGNSNVTPPTPTIKYLGWVSVDGVIKYSSTFNTAGEAQQYALTMYRQEGASNWDANDISWGVRPVQG